MCMTMPERVVEMLLSHSKFMNNLDTEMNWLYLGPNPRPWAVEWSCPLYSYNQMIKPNNFLDKEGLAGLLDDEVLSFNGRSNYPQSDRCS